MTFATRALTLTSLAALVALAPARAQVSASDSLALVAIYDEGNGPNWSVFPKWKSGPVAQWGGVGVSEDGRRVVSLRLSGSGVFRSGSLSPAIGDLSALERLNITLTSLGGTLAELLEKLEPLTALKDLSLYDNGLSGPSPDALGGFSALEELALGYNALSGPLPDTLGALPLLSSLDLTSSGLIGPVPLTYLDLGLEEAYFGDGVCLPNDPRFEVWLASIGTFTSDLRWPDDICAAALSVSPAALEFGEVAVGGDVGHSAVVANDGTTPVTGSVSLAESGPFSITSGGGAFTLAAGESLAVGVTFAPTEAGDAETTLSVTHNADGLASPIRVAVAGTGVADRRLAFSADSLGFGEVASGETVALSVTITNVGELPTGGVADVSGDPAFSATATGFDLEPGQAHTVTVAFTPPGTASYLGELRITHDADAPASPVVIPLTGGLGLFQIAGVVQNVRFESSPATLQRPPLAGFGVAFYEGDYGGAPAGTAAGTDGVFAWKEAEEDVAYTVAAFQTLSDKTELVRYRGDVEAWADDEAPDSVRIDLPVGLFERQLRLADALEGPAIPGLSSPRDADLVDGYDTASIRRLLADWAVTATGGPADALAQLALAEEALLTALGESRAVTTEMAQAIVAVAAAAYAAFSGSNSVSLQPPDPDYPTLNLLSYVALELVVAPALEAGLEGGAVWATAVRDALPIVIEEMEGLERSVVGPPVSEVQDRLARAAVAIGDRVFLDRLVAGSQGGLDAAVALTRGGVGAGDPVYARDATNAALATVRTRNRAAVDASVTARSVATDANAFADLFTALRLDEAVPLFKVFSRLQYGAIGTSTVVSSRRLEALRARELSAVLDRPFRPEEPFPTPSPATVLAREASASRLDPAPPPPEVDAYRQRVAEAVAHAEAGDRGAGSEAAVSLVRAERDLLGALFVAALPGYAARAEAAAVQAPASALMEAGLQSVFSRLALATALLAHAEGTVPLETVREQAADVDASLAAVLAATADLLAATEGAEVAPYVYATSEPTLSDDGTTVEVRATVTNGGGGPAEGVAVRLAFDAAVLSLETGPEAADVGTLAPGEAREFAWTLQVVAPDSSSASYDVAVAASNARAAGSGGAVGLRSPGGPVAAADAPGGGFRVGLVSPNPTAGRGGLEVTLPEPGPLRVLVYDVLGRLVATAYDGRAEAGTVRVDVGPGLGPGTYLVRVAGPTAVEVRRFTVAG